MSETNHETVIDSEETLEQPTSESEVDELTDEELFRLTDEEFDEYYNHRKLPEGFVRDTKESKSESKKEKEIEEDEDNIEEDEDDAGSEGADHIDEDDEEGKTSSDSSKKAPEETTEDNEEEKSSGRKSYKALYEDLLKPIKAIGKEIEIKSPDELRQLASMGIDYTKKMQAIKPMRKIVETLEQANINEKELNFLIDVSKGNKEAIKELLKRNNIEPMEVDLDNIKYTPSNHIISDNEIEFHTIMDEIKQSPYLAKITEITTKLWDDESRKLVVSNPRLLQGLFEEVSMGRFDLIQKEVERERLFGRGKGKSDIELYTTIVDQKVGEVNKAYEVQMQTNTKPKPKDTTVDKKKAAPLKGASGSPTGKRYKPTDLLEMSDSEFAKLDLSKLT